MKLPTFSPRLAFLSATILVCGAAARLPADEKRGQMLFRDQVQPILTVKCLACHAGEKPKGKLDLTRRDLALRGGATGPALVPGKPSESLLLEKLLAKEMPPKNPLSDEQIAAVRQWIEQGAPYEGEPLVAVRQRGGTDWWSLQPIRRPTPPVFSGESKTSQRVRTPIDVFILAKLHAAGLEPSPEADRATLIRRATFDLIGLPPAPEEVQAFVSDPSPDAYERLIDGLLASPHYGERWGRHWLDVVRFGESHGYETNLLRPSAWPYRDYVIRAFNHDTPFPQFVLEQLAGDALVSGEEGADWLTQSATGFLVGGVHDVVGNQTPEGAAQQRMDDLDDMITATSTAFLGLTVNCARCHDHKFDPIPQTDYYGLQALFAGVQHTERDVPAPDHERRRREASAVAAELARIDRRLDELEPLARSASAGGPARSSVNAKRNIERFAPVEARFVRFTVLATNNLEPCIDELEIYAAESPSKNLALATSGVKPTASSVYPNSTIHRLEHINDGKHGNSWSWISNEPGKGWVQLELPSAVTIDRIIWGRDREEKFKDRLAIDYRIEVAVEPEQWRVVASSADRVRFGGEAPPLPWGGFSGFERLALLKRQAELRERLPMLAPTMKLYLGTFKQPEATHLLVRGDPLQKGDAVKPAGVAVLKPALTLDANLPERERRSALAHWIGHPHNPLPARVMVNRIWHYHFGQGIVNTPSDLGFNGGQPSHPELLDWLASAYIANGWKLKPLHRLIMRSATYRQSAIGDRPSAREGQKADSNDRLLWHFPRRRLEAEAIRDSVLAVSGQLDRRMGGPGYFLWEKNTNYVVVFKPKAVLGPDEYRRMVYQFKPRTQQDPTFGAFDCPDAALVAPRRNASTTALQALNLLNSPFIVQQAEFFAERLKREAGDDPGAQATLGFRLAFGREPGAKELAAATIVIREHGAPAFCRAVYNANEFVVVE